ncbi:MAG: hypothetical protein Q7T22_06085 [Serpentinimonas sp.]|nr:hypothetical protein [Serpentinimonas sp.]MDO9612204.1 hypothetical protein [Serpentinimonas sp.]
MNRPIQHTTTPGAASYPNLVAEMKKLMAELQTLREQAIEAPTEQTRPGP